MFYNFPTAPRLADGSHVLAIDVFNNGCFSAVVRTADNKWHNLCLFDDKGDGGMTFVGLDSADLGSSAILLDDGYVAVIYDHHVSGGKVQIDAVRFDEQHTYTGRADNLKLFANNWYMLNKYGNNLLFNNMHELKQSNFNSAEVFNLGYALQPKKSASAGEWSLFTLKGTFVKSYDNVVDFVGDGNVLLAIGEKEMELRSFTGESLLKKPVACFEKFADGTFVLTTTDGLSRMYRPDGSPLSVEVKNATFLPGGLFIQYDGKLIVGMYGPDGLLDRREVYSFERTGYYYVLNDSVDNGVLYSAESKERIGNDFVLLKSAGLFSLFKNLHTKELVLMNHNGAVLTMFSEEEA